MHRCIPQFPQGVSCRTPCCSEIEFTTKNSRQAMQSHTLYLQAEQPGFREDETGINLDGVSVKVPPEETMMVPENPVLRRLTPEDMRAPVTPQDICEKMESGQSTTQPD